MTRWIISGLALALAGAPVAPAETPAPAPAAATPATAGMPGFDLTPDQRRQAADIMRRMQPALQAALAAEARAQTALFRAVHGPVYDEAAIRAASRELARCEENLALLRAQLTRDLRALLTPAQLERMDRLHAEMLAALERKQADSGRLLDEWIRDYGTDR